MTIGYMTEVPRPEGKLCQRHPRDPWRAGRDHAI
jgi:hypothetical protein